MMEKELMEEEMMEEEMIEEEMLFSVLSGDKECIFVLHEYDTVGKFIPVFE